MQSSQKNQVQLGQGKKVRKRSLRSLVSEMLGRKILTNELLLILERGREIGKKEPWLKAMCTGGLGAHISSAIVEFKRKEMLAKVPAQQTGRKSYGTSSLSWSELDIKYDRKQRYETRPNRFARKALGSFRRGRNKVRSMKVDQGLI